MKKTVLIMLMLLATIGLYSQVYQLNFAGAGAINKVDSVLVYNLQTNAKLQIAGSDILKLVPSAGINNYKVSGSKSIEVYPNPSTDYTFVEFDLFVREKVLITVIDITGKELFRSEQELDMGRQRLSLKGLSGGVYLVKINTGSTFYNVKILSTNKSKENKFSIKISQREIKQPENKAVKAKNNIKKAGKSIIEMEYNAGDLLKLTGKSDNYLTVVMQTVSKDEEITFNFVECKDADNNNYAVIGIGEQLWMMQNLNIGVKINGSQEQTNNSMVEKYCYEDKESNCAVYGGLYQWNEMMQYIEGEKGRGICPIGWHIPSDDDWKELEIYLGMSQSEADKQNAWRGTDEGGKLKESGFVHWDKPNTGATNSSGFTALAGGYRAENGVFISLNAYAVFWTSTHYSSGFAWDRYLNAAYSEVFRFSPLRSYGNSVRCVKD